MVPMYFFCIQARSGKNMYILKSWTKQSVIACDKSKSVHSLKVMAVILLSMLC